MAKIYRASWSLISIMALLSNSLNPTVQAGFQRVGQGVVRIDLEKKYLKNMNLQLSDDIDMDKMILIDNQEQSEGEIELILDANLRTNENNYSVLRETQRKTLKQSMR
jgi:hypothetical protein